MYKWNRFCVALIVHCSERDECQKEYFGEREHLNTHITCELSCKLILKKRHLVVLLVNIFGSCLFSDFPRRLQSLVPLLKPFDFQLRRIKMAPAMLAVVAIVAKALSLRIYTF